MKIKRFFAPDMRHAIRMVRNEQGPEAVILSSREVDGGIEIISAMDYDQKLISEMVQTAEKAVQTPPIRDLYRNKRDTKYSTQLQISSQAGFKQPALEQKSPTQDAIDKSPKAEHVKRADEALPNMERTALKAENYSTQAQQVLDDNKAGWEDADSHSIDKDQTLHSVQQELATMKGLLQEQLSQLAWGDYLRSHPVKGEHLKRLGRLGFDTKIAHEIVNAVREADDPVKSWREVMHRIAKSVPVSRDNIIENGGTVTLVGPTGVGKTTTLAKLAARYALRYGRDQLAMVNVDTYRIGAQKQLQTFGQILGVPVIMTGYEKLSLVLEGLADKKLILIDTAGFGPRDPRNKSRFECFAKISNVTTFLTLAANTQRVALEEVIQTFGVMGLKGCILTKLDEATSLGDALSVTIHHRLPLAFVSDGQRVPEDLHFPRVMNLLTQAIYLAQRFKEDRDDESSIWPLRVTRAEEVSVSA